MTPSYLQRFNQIVMDWKHTVSRAIRRVGNMSPAGEYLAESVEEKLVLLLSQGRQQLIQEAVELGEGLKVEVQNDRAKAWDMGFNAAITAYQEKLNKLV